MKEKVLGIDLGGTHIKGCLLTLDGDILDRREVATNDTGDARWTDAVRDLVTSLSGAENGTDAGIEKIGLAAPGVAAADSRSIVHMPGRMRGLEGLVWSEAIDAGLTVPVLNDSHAFTLGEAWLGAAKDCRHAVVLTLGTGVGGGVISNGDLLQGHLQRAGHLGHLSLDPEGDLDCTRTPGSLEDAIGELTLAKRSAGRFTRTIELLDAAAGGDQQAAELWTQSIRALAAGVSSFINLFDPEKVVIGGGIAQAGEALFEPLRARLEEIEWRWDDHPPVPVVPAQLGRWAGAIGAARFALRRED